MPPKKKFKGNARYLEPTADIDACKAKHLEKLIQYFHGVYGLMCCRHPQVKKQTKDEYEAYITELIKKEYFTQTPSISEIQDILATSSEKNNDCDITGVDGDDDLNQQYAPSSDLSETRTQTQVRLACDTLRLKNSIIDAPNILQCIIDSYVMSQEQLHGAMYTWTLRLPRNDDESEGDYDDRLRHNILIDANCPDFVTDLSKNRPSVFNVMCTVKFKPEFIAIQLAKLREIEAGQGSFDKSYMEVLAQMPQGRKLIRGFQEEAYKNMNNKKSKLNLQ